MTDFSKTAVDAAIKETGQTDRISTALARAQSSMTNAIYNQTNPHFRSRYADLASVRHATMQHLSAQGISLVQRSGYDEHNNYVLFTELLYKDQKLQDVQPLLLAPDKPQMMISSRTYSRRAGWTSICGIAVEGEDDDGNAATTKSISPAQIAELEELVRQAKVSAKVFCDGVSAKLGYEIDNLADIKPADLLKVKSWLMAKADKVMEGKS